MPRSTKEWIGKTDDAKIPPRVRLRVYDKTNGFCDTCHRKIGAAERWDCDHVVALCNGGAHAESNLVPRCLWCHRKKTNLDLAAKSLTARIRKSTLGIKTPSRHPVPGSKNSKWAARYNRETGRFETVFREPKS
jgi:5-methylcytosine-specific restriction enzyme A